MLRLKKATLGTASGYESGFKGDRAEIVVLDSARWSPMMTADFSFAKGGQWFPEQDLE